MALLAICPSRGRPAQAAETLASFETSCRDPRSRIVFVVDRDDPTLELYPTAHTVVVEPGGCMGAALRTASRDPEVLRDASSVGMVGDDNRFRTPGWDVTFDTFLAAAPGIAYGDDGLQHERLPTSWWLSRPIVDLFGLVGPPLRHYYMDNWAKSLGEGAGILRYFPDVEIEHLHPLAGKATTDEIYRRGELEGRNDRAIFRRWELLERRADVAKVATLVDRGRPRRVLADWHHPALYESLAILFEDRFGWELYSPLGLDWTRHGWTFANGTPGWTAADYLEHPSAVDRGTHHELAVAEYPERPRKLVTWPQANAMRFDFVLASVAVHQRPFAELARRFRARLIHQVGNARHPIDATIPQVILASAIIPRQRRLSVVTYHQEFSRELFGYRPPADRARVASFMLRLDRTSGPYAWLAEAPGVKWEAVGGADPRDASYLAPMSRVAERLAKTGWVWHDKLIGDGYGHVLHNAASMGRPLIGHASHYRGLLGEPLWRDLRTCIDLDRHDELEALRLWRAIVHDPDWYRELTEATAATFRELVDFDAEAACIREALT